jgi:hypothetical protein
VRRLVVEGAGRSRFANVGSKRLTSSCFAYAMTFEVRGVVDFCCGWPGMSGQATDYKHGEDKAEPSRHRRASLRRAVGESSPSPRWHLLDVETYSFNSTVPRSTVRMPPRVWSSLRYLPE